MPWCVAAREGRLRVGQWFIQGLMTATLLISTRALADNGGAALRFGVGDAFANDPPAQVQQRLELYQQAGIGILRVDVDWRTQETHEGVWQATPNLALLQLGQRAHFKLKANIGSITSPPLWFFERHPDAQLKNRDGLPSYNDISYWYPGLHTLLEQKDNRLFASLSRQGLLASIAYLVVPLGPAGEPLYPAAWTTTAPNAPMRFWFYDPNAQADFPRRMQAKYRKIEVANRAWGSSFTSWAQVTIPLPGSQPGPLWRDVLEWYRDTKREFVLWQLDHYRRLLKQYYPSGPQPQLLILVPGNHITQRIWDEAVRTGDGADAVKVMSDSEFLLDAAERVGAATQYTGLPNPSEVEYLQSYLRSRHYHLILWGENAGNAGEPRALDEEVFANGLYGLEYIGSNLFAADHVTPTEKLLSLKSAHAWLSDVWAGRQTPVMSFEDLPVVQNTCVYADPRRTISLCMQKDANLVLRSGTRMLWASDSAHSEPGFCGVDGDAARACYATFQGDGNLVVYQGRQPLWASGTAARGQHLIFASHAPYLQILSPEGQAVWTAPSK